MLSGGCDDGGDDGGCDGDGGDDGGCDGDGGGCSSARMLVGFQLKDLTQTITLLLLLLLCLKPWLSLSSSRILSVFDYKNNIIYSTNTLLYS